MTFLSANTTSSYFSSAREFGSVSSRPSPAQLDQNTAHTDAVKDANPVGKDAPSAPANESEVSARETRPHIDPAARALVRTVAVGREEMLRQNIERAASARSVARSEASAASLPTPRPAPGVPSSSAPTNVRELGRHGTAVGGIADELRNAGLVTAEEHRELTNGTLGPQDVRIGGEAINRVQASTPNGIQLMTDALRLQNEVNSYQTEQLGRDADLLREAVTGGSASMRPVRGLTPQRDSGR